MEQTLTTKNFLHVNFNDCLRVLNVGVVCDGCIFLSNKVEADSRSDMVDGGGVYIVTSSSFRDPAKDMWVKELIRRRYGDEISSFVGPSPSLFVNCTFDGNLVWSNHVSRFLVGHVFRRAFAAAAVWCAGVPAVLNLGFLRCFARRGCPRTTQSHLARGKAALYPPSRRVRCASGKRFCRLNACSIHACAGLRYRALCIVGVQTMHVFKQ